MSKIKSPQLKKKLAYDDSVTPAEYSHAFRKKYPKKKALAQRAARRTVRQVLSATADADAVTIVRRKRVRKWAAITVRESLAQKRQKREALINRKRRNRTRA
jgi:hypothetical protein